MRVAVIGAGISGICATDRLAQSHDVTLFERSGRLGGHTNTVTVEVGGAHHVVDTGFIVFNERNYPTFCAFLDRWGVASQPSDMSFSVSSDRSGLEYSGTGLNGLFAQRRNLVAPRHYTLIWEIARFGRIGTRALESGLLGPAMTTQEFLGREGFSQRFVEEYLVPLGAAVWSADPRTFTSFPAVSLLRFLNNHGLLLFRDRPQWRTIQGGSARYLEAFAGSSQAAIRLETPVRAVRRQRDHVSVETDASTESFDVIVLATHSDQARQILADPSSQESAMLAAVRYQPNTAVLHTDVSVLPDHRRSWASWNYHLAEGSAEAATVTYWMNRLQGIECSEELLVTLNRTDSIDPARVLGVFEYEHPVYDVGAFAAQKQVAKMNGHNRTWFAGAWNGYGFHEDGAASGDRVARGILG